MYRMFQWEIERVKADVAEEKKKRRVLRDLDCFVLDNSIRESTLGHLRGHTLENKVKIFEEVKKCGFKNIIVAALCHMTRVDDTFIKLLVERGEDMSTLYSFVEVTEGVKKGEVDTKTIPVGLRKMKQHGLRNPIIEVDLADKSIDWNKFTVQDMCKLINQRMQWARSNLSSNAKLLINLRDFPIAMEQVPQRVFILVDYLASMTSEERPMGFLCEEATGNYLPEELAAWTAGVRRVMDAKNWNLGKLLVHVHKRWGLGESVQLECLTRGANGIWASVAEEGLASGHACSTITLMNLVRMGNTKVLEQYNCTYLQQAAREVTKITTGNDPNPKQVVYGERALDMSFDLGNIAGGFVRKGEFDIAAFFGETPPTRISTHTPSSMIMKRLTELFGENPQFNEATSMKMKEVMLEDLRTNRKEEYMSAAGLAVLFDRSGGMLTSEMGEKIAEMELKSKHAEDLLADVRAIWDRWDLLDKVESVDALQFESFYNGFMAPYFGCFKCACTKHGLQAIDLDEDGLVNWSEFAVYLKWALHHYPEIKDTDELLSITFRKGLIPIMHDEFLKV